jgi:hypothetical protein
MQITMIPKTHVNMEKDRYTKNLSKSMCINWLGIMNVQ